MKLMSKIRKNSQAGAALVEYALIVALIAAAVAGTVFLVGAKVDEKFNEVIDAMDQSGEEPAPPAPL